MIQGETIVPVAALVISVVTVGFAFLTFRQTADKNYVERLERRLKDAEQRAERAERERDEAERKEQNALRRLYGKDNDGSHDN